MGGGESKSKYGAAFVQTHKSYYDAGEIVTGTISVQIQEAFPATKLVLKVKGKEKCKWVVRKSRHVPDGDGGHTEYYNDWHDHKHKIFEYESPIYTFDGSYIPPGQYQFPFTFGLPPNIPSSAYYTGSSSARAQVKYECKVKFKAKDNSYVKDIKQTSQIIVRQMAKFKQDNIQVKAEQKFNKCCCFCSAGKAQMSAVFEKDTYNSLETAKAFAMIDNSKCKIKPKKLSIKLVQHVTLRTGGHVLNQYFTVMKKEYDGFEDMEEIKQEVEINLSENKQTLHADSHWQPGIDGRIDKPLNETEMRFAEFLQPTVNGEYVQIYYTIDIQMKYNGTCCATDAIICKNKMFLQPPEFQIQQQIQEPIDWNPDVYEEVQFRIPNQGYSPPVGGPAPLEREPTE